MIRFLALAASIALACAAPVALAGAPAALAPVPTPAPSPAPPAPRPPTAMEILAARAEADRLIAETDGAGDVTTGQLLVEMHWMSLLTRLVDGKDAL